MRYSKVLVAVCGAAVLAASTFAVAGAIISGSSGQLVLLSTNPASVASGALESPTNTYAFNEAQGTKLAAPLAVDLVNPGTYTTYPGGFTIPTGTLVDSHLIHSDVPKGGGVTRTRTGTLTFTDNVLGLIVDDKELSASDFLGAPGTTYSGTLKNRGLDTSQDSITLSANRKTVSFSIYTEGVMDEIRVITVHTNLVATTISDSPDPVQAGSNVSYLITVKNNEPYPISNLQVADSFPGATLVSASAGCTGTTSVTCSFGNVAKGVTKTATIVVKAPSPAPAGGSITNSATSPPGQNPVVSQTTAVVSPVLDTTIADSPGSVTAGNNVQYTLTVTNNGIDTVADAHVIDTIPAGTALVTTTALNGCTGSTTIDCGLGPLAVGASTTAEIVVTSPATVPDSGTITDTAVAAPGSNTSASETTTVTAPEPGVTSGFVIPGDTITTNGDTPADITLPPTGDGAPVIITQGPGTFCDGPCTDLTTTISSFDGYSDPAHPISLLLTFNFPDSPGTDSLTAAAIAYNSDIFKNTDPSHPDDGTIVPVCNDPGSGVADPHPCVQAKTITQPTPNSFVVTFTILYLSGDPSYGRK